MPWPAPPALAQALAGLALAALLPGAAAQEQARDQAAEHGRLLDAPDRIEWEAGGLYEGRLEDGARFQIELAYGAPATAPAAARGIMPSAYWNPRQFTGAVAALEARPAAPGSLLLVRTPQSGAPGGERFAITLGPDRREGRGSWSAANGRQLAFSLRRLVPYRAVALTRPAPEAQAEGSNQRFTYSALFPVLGDEAVDAWVRARAATCEASIDCANQVRVAWHSNGLLSLEAGIWSYSLGAAHGQYVAIRRHYGLAGGKPVHVRFTNFVDAGAACRQKVSTLLVAKLTAQGLSWPEEGTLDDLREPEFSPTPEGIVFHWNPYEVGSYAQGAPRVFLTRAELGDCARNLPRYE